MDKQKVIEKDPGLIADQDYAFLREAGLGYIEKLSGKIWTDYNEHDPGITILEALCYAITELGYRTGMPMEDLLTGADGKIASSQTLFTAKNILTQSPLTVNDYRKLLIDIVGVHNAWFLYDDFYTVNNKDIPAGEIALYADCKKDELSYDVTPHPVYLSGLYKVILDLDFDQQFGDLNNGELQVLNPATAKFKGGDVSLTIIFPVWNDTTIAGLLSADPASITGVTTSFPAGNNITITIDFNYTSGGANHAATLNGIINIDLQPSGQQVLPADVQGFFTANFTAQVLNLYLLKIQQSKHIVQTAVRTLNENRNLCEDFVSVTTIKDEEIAICCDIEVSPSADMEQIQAQVFYVIEDYMNPSVNFYLLSELQDKGNTTDTIFEGPVLQHGFIDTAELEQTQLRQEIYASDIISLIMDIDGVLAVRNFLMTKYGTDNKAIPGQKAKSWCMPVTTGCKPVFSETKSKLLFYKNQFPYLPSLTEVRDTLKWLRAVKARNKLSGHTDDLAVPTGTYSALDSYTSVQYLLPQTYGVGSAGLPSTVSEERKAQARQLQAYLLLFDQLLADFFSQLNGAKELFSTDNIVQTYYAQFLGDIKNIAPVYKQDTSAKTIEQLVMQIQDSAVATMNSWQQLYESNDVFADRRNRFLDHLMSRFGESFNEYVLLNYSLDYDTQKETHITPADLIDSKISFLKDYPVISYQRARGFNYFPQKDDLTVDAIKLWDTDNVSGLEKKLCHLGGIDNYYRRFLYCIGNATIITTTDTPAKYQFVFKNPHGDTLTSAATYTTQEELNKALPAFMDRLLAGQNYAVKETGTNWNIYVFDKAYNNLAVSNNFTSEQDANTALAQFITEFNTECDADGLHLIEHLLLRPRNNLFARPPVCLDPKCDFCGEQDPYSFKMSVVLPYWPVHFRNMAFRNYFEDIIRQEVPAHTMVKVCWINDQSLYDFENAYKTWITALANYSFDNTTITDLQKANDVMVPLLFNLHSEYPLATLHDCEESKDTNPVMLGKTILGSLKN
ncbi:hypothetical protein SNE25_18735 [Mucilaginibacter sabulilitoris]|uniref:Baseplate protein J-like domain-containing protein n=1 Tax=Mucilaginibacter sabulilitoris TaxID=1173583 RepID=A0ABZ0TGM9_9SPHI|nr:hypothetical protein [Mucilaginibacter sabulilitoris]WPU91358.1 hypothetical protein SNE25_18735 [Mucilaginibacter sabulilitoris]